MWHSSRGARLGALVFAAFAFALYIVWRLIDAWPQLSATRVYSVALVEAQFAFSPEGAVIVIVAACGFIGSLAAAVRFRAPARTFPIIHGEHIDPADIELLHELKENITDGNWYLAVWNARVIHAGPPTPTGEELAGVRSFLEEQIRELQEGSAELRRALVVRALVAEMQYRQSGQLDLLHDARIAWRHVLTHPWDHDNVVDFATSRDDLIEAWLRTWAATPEIQTGDYKEIAHRLKELLNHTSERSPELHARMKALDVAVRACEIADRGSTALRRSELESLRRELAKILADTEQGGNVEWKPRTEPLSFEVQRLVASTGIAVLTGLTVRAIVVEPHVPVASLHAFLLPLTAGLAGFTARRLISARDGSSEADGGRQSASKGPPPDKEDMSTWREEAEPLTERVA